MAHEQELDAQEMEARGMVRVPLKEHEIYNTGPVHWNMHVALLVQQALARGEGTLATNGALVARTGSRTGRSPKDKFIVEDPASKENIVWGSINRPMSREAFEKLRQRMLAYLQGREVFVFDGFAGADPDYQVPIRVVTEFAWHNLFVHQLFRRVKREDLIYHRPEFVLICAPNFQAVPERDGTRSEAFVVVDLEQKIVLIGGTKYAGEMKKSIFSVLNYVYPQRDVFPMHCSANMGEDDDVALFFGLSGTGKTTLSSDPQRRLIGDDEHGWSPNGVFNFEGGCYAKCINLSKKYEPLIWNAIRFGCVLENVVLDPLLHHPQYSDSSITENTRAAYPIEHIDNAVLSGVGGHPKVVFFLAADAFGVLPPIARLTPEQAMYHFISGYTAKLGGTEAGMGSEPEATFSSCFGAPFLPLSPTVYAKMLGDRTSEHNVPVYLINTGWTGGPYGVGERIRIDYTRAIISAAINQSLKDVEWEKDPIFGFEIPKSCPGVPSEILNPATTWENRERYNSQARDLARRFIKNFEKFPEASEEVRNAGPKL